MQRIVLTIVVVLFVGYEIGHCCGPSEDTGANPGEKSTAPGEKPNTPEKSGGANDNVLTRSLGPNAKASAYGPSSQQDPPAASPDLKCDFDSGPCCWDNVKAPADTLDYLLIDSADVDADQFQKSFSTSTQPKGKYVGSGSAVTSDTALFASCPIACAKGDVLVTLNHWQASGIAVSVCALDASGAQVKCVPVPATEVPGPSLITIPGSKDMKIGILSTNFPGGPGGMSLIDDINVTYESCASNGSSASSGSPAGAGGACGAQCDTASMCAYKPSGAGEPWAVQNGQLNNHVTGVRTRKDNKPYLGTFMNHSSTESSMTAELNPPLANSVTYAFEYYGATDQMVVNGCCDSACSFTSTVPITSDSLQWQKGTLTCPAGTKAVTFKCANSGPNQGACGVHSVQAQDASGKSVC